MDCPTRRWSTGLVATAVLVAGAAAAADSWPILVYPAPRAAAPPRLDGRLDDACWRAAPVVSGFIGYDRDVLVPTQTSFRVTWDDAALYLGVWCDEPQLDRLVPTPQPRDAKGIFSTEAIEIFVDPRHDHRDYYQWAVNAAGSVFDGRVQDVAFDSGATATAAKGAGGWGLEARLPWAPLGVKPAAGQVIGLNVCRDRTLTQDREWSCWSRVDANFHDPQHFGHVVLDGTPERIADLTGELRRGDRTGELRLFGVGGVGSDTYQAMLRRALTRVEAVLADLQQHRAGEPPATQQALDARLAPYLKRLATVREQATGDLDGAAYTRLEMELATIERELGTVLWAARLEGLLGTI